MDGFWHRFLEDFWTIFAAKIDSKSNQNPSKINTKSNPKMIGKFNVWYTSGGGGQKFKSVPPVMVWVAFWLGALARD